MFGLARAGSIIVGCLLLGCVAPADRTDPVVEVPPISFDCTHASYTPADVCVTALGMDGDRWSEPFVAAHPSEAGTFVVAVQGGGAQEAVPGPVPNLPVGGSTLQRCPWFQTCLFVTENGGGTWRLTSVGNNDLGPDPILAFVGDQLLVAALTNDNPVGGILVYRTSDLGQTWDAAKEVVRREGTDRPWMNAHGDDVLLVWQTSGKQEGWWSRSRDGGQTWSDPGAMPCNLHAKPAYTEAWIVACSGSKGTHVYRLAEEMALVATLAGGSGTRMMAYGDGDLWITAPGPARLFRGEPSGDR